MTREPLAANDLLARLNPARCLITRIIVLNEVTSTNDVAAKLGSSGETEGLVVFAERQTAGRGRLGRVWESPACEGLWFSALLRPAMELHLWMRLTTWAAVSVAEGIDRALGTRCAIKWPNDIYLDGKKVAGILSEIFHDQAGTHFAVTGIGANVNQTEFPPALTEKAASLRQICHREIDRRELAVSILNCLDEFYLPLTTDFSQLTGNAAQRSNLIGEKIAITNPTETVEGIATGLDANGALLVRDRSGAIVTFSSGEVVSAARIPAADKPER